MSTNTTMIWCPQRRDMSHCKCLPMKEFAPECKYKMIISLGCPYIEWYPWKYLTWQSPVYLAQGDRRGRSKERENPDRLHCCRRFKCSTIVSLQLTLNIHRLILTYLDQWLDPLFVKCLHQHIFQNIEICPQKMYMNLNNLLLRYEILAFFHL